MARRKKSTGPKPHKFRNKLLLNQWLISCFGIDPLASERKRPFSRLAKLIKDPKLEGLDKDNLHYFHHILKESDLFVDGAHDITPEKLLIYEENIVRHTQAINAKRVRPVIWKYYQWLSLLFVELCLDQYFGDKDRLLQQC